MFEKITRKRICRTATLAFCAAVAVTVAVGSNRFAFGYDIVGLGKTIQTVSAAAMTDETASDAQGYYLKLITGEERNENSFAGTEGVEACVLYVSGNPVVALSDEAAMEELLTEYEKDYSGDMRTMFMQAIDRQTEWVDADSVCTVEEAKEILSATDENGVPVLSVLSAGSRIWEEEIPFETVYEETDTLAVGHSVVKTPGESGMVRHYGLALQENGQVLSSMETAQRKLKDPVTEVVLVGTREPGTGEGTGTYIKPCVGKFSSGFGARWGRMHSGVDLAAPVGTDIIASDAGTVKKAEWNNGGYGNLVVIDHGNGVETWYAHCNELLVKAGDVVEQGELIARVGNTGRSTGSHLHFEVRIGGNAVDPTGYVSLT